jgi:hypothetical protein
MASSKFNVGDVVVYHNSGTTGQCSVVVITGVQVHVGRRPAYIIRYPDKSDDTNGGCPWDENNFSTVEEWQVAETARAQTLVASIQEKAMALAKVVEQVKETLRPVVLIRRSTMAEQNFTVHAKSWVALAPFLAEHRPVSWRWTGETPAEVVELIRQQCPGATIKFETLTDMAEVQSLGNEKWIIRPATAFQRQREKSKEWIGLHMHATAWAYTGATSGECLRQILKYHRKASIVIED